MSARVEGAGGRFRGRLPLHRMVVFPAVALVGCDALGPRACTTEFVYGIAVTVVDAETSAPVTEGLEGITVKNGVSSPMEALGNRLLGAGEDEGVHSVVITAGGYELWTRDGVRVEADECHVSTVRLTAPLRASTG